MPRRSLEQYTDVEIIDPTKHKARRVARKQRSRDRQSVILYQPPCSPESTALCQTINNFERLQLKESWFAQLPARMGYSPAIDAGIQAFMSSNQFFYTPDAAAVQGCIQTYVSALQRQRHLLVSAQGKLSDAAVLSCALLGHFERCFQTINGDAARGMQSTLLHMHAMQTILLERVKTFGAQDLDRSLIPGHCMMFLEIPIALGVPSPWETIAMEDPSLLIGHKAFSPTSKLQKISIELMLASPRFIADVRTHREAETVDLDLLKDTLRRAKQLAALKDEEAENALLHNVRIQPTDQRHSIPLANYSFHFSSLADFVAIVHYWLARILILRACWHLPTDSTFSSPLDHNELAKEGRRAASSLLMSWQFGLHQSMFGLIVLLYLPASLWGGLADFYTDEDIVWPEAREAFLEHINRMYWMMLGDVSEEDMDDIADVFAGGPRRGPVVTMYERWWPGSPKFGSKGRLNEFG